MNLVPRRVHRLYARIFGYFWLPCPLCGRFSGGHEWRDRRGLSSRVQDPDRPTFSYGICPFCTRSGCGDQDPVRD